MDLEERLNKLERIIYGSNVSDGMLQLIATQSQIIKDLEAQMHDMKKTLSSIEKQNEEIRNDIYRLKKNMGYIVGLASIGSFLLGTLVHFL